MKNYLEKAVILVNSHKFIVLFYLVAAFALKSFSITYAHNNITPFLSLFLSLLLNATISSYFVFNIQKTETLKGAFRRVTDRIASILGYSFIYIGTFLLMANYLTLTPDQQNLLETGLAFLTLFVLPLMLFTTTNPLIAIAESIKLVLENLVILLISIFLIGVSALLVLLGSMSIISIVGITKGPIVLLSEMLLLTYLIIIFSALISIIYVDQYKGR